MGVDLTLTAEDPAVVLENLSGYGERLHNAGACGFIEIGRIPAFDRPAGQLGKLDRRTEAR